MRHYGVKLVLYQAHYLFNARSIQQIMQQKLWAQSPNQQILKLSKAT